MHGRSPQAMRDPTQGNVVRTGQSRFQVHAGLCEKGDILRRGATFNPRPRRRHPGRRGINTTLQPVQVRPLIQHHHAAGLPALQLHLPIIVGRKRNDTGTTAHVGHQIQTEAVRKFQVEHDHVQVRAVSRKQHGSGLLEVACFHDRRALILQRDAHERPQRPHVLHHEDPLRHRAAMHNLTHHDGTPARRRR